MVTLSIKEEQQLDALGDYFVAQISEDVKDDFFDENRQLFNALRRKSGEIPGYIE